MICVGDAKHEIAHGSRHRFRVLRHQPLPIVPVAPCLTIDLISGLTTPHTRACIFPARLTSYTLSLKLMAK
jgi:hypothetical protein